MKTLLGLVLLVGVAAQEPERPWMRCDPVGDAPCPEKSCGLAGDVDRLRREKPDAIILACDCKHTCDPLNDHAAETGGLQWDATCAARCDPNNCKCPDPCTS